MADPDNSALVNARKRARRRLVGAVVLALAAAVVLPMFLESDPKPLGPDVQIQIPAIDDAKFQNRLTPAGASKAPAADKPAPVEGGQAQRETADTGTVAAPATTAAVTDTAVNRSEPPASPPTAAAASRPGETKSAASPASATIASPAATTARKSGAPANPAAATPPAAPSPAATSPAAAPAKKSAVPVPAPATAPATERAPAAALPAFSLTATVPPLGAAPASNPNPAAPAAPAVAQGEFVVQLGAFVDSAVARDLAAKAGEQGFPAFLEAVTTKSGQVQRVRVGPFATRAEADAAAARLKGAGFTAVARPR